MSNPFIYSCSIPFKFSLNIPRLSSGDRNQTTAAYFQTPFPLFFCLLILIIFKLKVHYPFNTKSSHCFCNLRDFKTHLLLLILPSLIFLKAEISLFLFLSPKDHMIIYLVVLFFVFILYLCFCFSEDNENIKTPMVSVLGKLKISRFVLIFMWRK